MNIVIFCSLLAVIYTFIGYPVWLYFKEKINRRARKTCDYGNKKISVVMVVCNESSVIEDKIKNIFSFDYDPKSIFLIIVDDASTDGTTDIIRGVNDDRITLLQNKSRLGKAAGINKAMLDVNTELVLLLDARQRVTSNALKDLSSWFYPGSRVAAVSGELKFNKNECGSSTGMDAYQKYEKYIRNTEAKVYSVPGVSGAIYMLRRDLFEEIPEDTILDDVLIPMNAAKEGYWVGFDDRVIAWDVSSDDMVREKRRKTRTLNGNYQVLFRNTSWLIPGVHPIWFPYLSHKIMRLTAPFLVILSISLSMIIALKGNMLYMALGASLSFGVLLYPLSLYFNFINNNKILRITVSFVALNWFNLLGFYQYLFSPKVQSWK